MRRAILLLACTVVAGCQERGVQPTQTVVTSDTADQILYGMQHSITQDGIRRSLVDADTAYFYEPTQTVRMLGLRVTFYSDAGEVTSILTADSGDYHWQDGAMTARGNVVGRSQDGGRVLRTTVLNYEPHSEQITSNEPFTFNDRGNLIRGNGFRSDMNFTNFVVNQPRGTEGGAQPLPGQ